MPIKKSAIKHLRQTKNRTARRNKVKQDLKRFIKSVRRAVAAKDQNTLQELRVKIQKIIDKSSQKKIINKNNAARKKSRLIKQINAVFKS